MTVRSLLRWVTPVLAAVELGLVLTGRLRPATAAVVFVVVETVLSLAAVGLAVGGVRRYRAERAVGRPVGDALGSALGAVLPGPIAFVVRHELSGLASLVRAVLRRPDVPAGATALRYARALRPMAAVIVGMSVVELFVLELVIPWRTVRLVLIVLGAYSLLAVLSLVAGTVVRPHLVDAGSLRLRWSDWVDVRVPVDGAVTVAARRHDAPGRTLLVRDGILRLAVAGETTVEVVLPAPVVVTVGRRTEAVRVVRFAADDPRCAADAVRAALAAPVVPRPGDD
jgi:hypothetical protein